MVQVTEECYERAAMIFEDIDYACDTDDEYEEWEEVASDSFAAFLDELDTERFDMTCAAVRDKIIECFDDGRGNYAKGIRAAFRSYLYARVDYLDFSGEYDKPELPEDADDSDREEYDEAMDAFYEKKEYNDCAEKWIASIGGLRLE